MTKSLYSEYEKKLKLIGHDFIAGIDEAGRGPLAGPVVAACVVLDLDKSFKYVNDSKKLSVKNRNLAYKEILEKAISIGIGIVDNKEIDKINILEATKKAMLIALSKIDVKYSYVLIDAVDLKLENSLSIIKGDQKSISIAAASVVAKVTRDEIMNNYDKKYPNYLFKNHKGYGTKKHLEMLEKYGPSEIHRISYKGVIIKK